MAKPLTNFYTCVVHFGTNLQTKYISKPIQHNSFDDSIDYVGRTIYKYCTKDPIFIYDRIWKHVIFNTEPVQSKVQYVFILTLNDNRREKIGIRWFAN